MRVSYSCSELKGQYLNSIYHLQWSPADIEARVVQDDHGQNPLGKGRISLARGICLFFVCCLESSPNYENVSITLLQVLWERPYL
jgi:hypothetical protein